MASVCSTRSLSLIRTNCKMQNSRKIKAIQNTTSHRLWIYYSGHENTQKEKTRNANIADSLPRINHAMQSVWKALHK